MSLFGNDSSEFETELLDEEIIGKDVKEKITYWILKIIIEMGGHKRFIDSDNDFEEEEMANFLGLEKYVEFDYDDFDRTEPLMLLKKRLKRLRKKAPFSSSVLLRNSLN